MVARKFAPAQAAQSFAWRDTQDIRNEIERVCPTYNGIANLQKKGDQFQYGGPHLLAERCLTPDGLGHFSVVALPEEAVPAGRFLLATRRGKQFNSIMFAEKDPITGATREDIIISAEDAGRMGLKNGDAMTLRNEHGSFTGRARIDQIKPGCLQAHWPEVNVIIPAGRLDPSGVPDYNATVEVVGASCLNALDVSASGSIAAD
jgi:anaerobic selenocysteine-containing dehydrogenase